MPAAPVLRVSSLVLALHEPQRFDAILRILPPAITRRVVPVAGQLTLDENHVAIPAIGKARVILQANFAAPAIIDCRIAIAEIQSAAIVFVDRALEPGVAGLMAVGAWNGLKLRRRHRSDDRDVRPARRRLADAAGRTGRHWGPF